MCAIFFSIYNTFIYVALLILYMSVTIVYKLGDSAPLTYQIADWNIDTQGNEPTDLSNKTVTFSMIKDGSSVWDIENQPCSIVTAASGLIEYAWASGETDNGGMYRCVFKVIDSNGKIASYPEYDVQWLWIVDDSVV